MVDVINNVSWVRVFGATLRERKKFALDVGYEMNVRQVSLRYPEKIRILHAEVIVVLAACVLGWVVIHWAHGEASPGDVVLVITLGFTVLHGTRDSAVALVEMVQDWARLGEALFTLLVPHHISNRPSARALVAPGDHIGLVGGLGSRKTLFLALLQQHYDPAAGRVLIDGIDVTVLSRDSLSTPISVVSKDVQLFHRLVMENIRYGEDATDDEVLEAARAAFTDDFIKALPQGYDTLEGERGIKLSGGQRQRLAIARTFLREPPILLLDEATSALNSESEVCVHEAIDQLPHGRTGIAVAHWLSTSWEFDRIMEIENGCVAKEGALEQLARRPGPIWICFGTNHNQCQRSRFERI